MKSGLEYLQRLTANNYALWMHKVKSFLFLDFLKNSNLRDCVGSFKIVTAVHYLCALLIVK